MTAPAISPSMMCVDFAEIPETLSAFERAGIEYLHIDIMDGSFVQNYTLGTDFCKKLRKMTHIPLDIHLMVERPDLKLDWFDLQPGEYCAVHWESTPHVQRVLTAIRAVGAKAMLALNPATPIQVLEYLLDALDGVLIMTVNPGFAGQKLIPSTLEKIRQTRSFLDSHGHPEIVIEVDGNVSFENSVKMRKAGADIFVGGSSSVFHISSKIDENIEKMRQMLQSTTVEG